MSSLFYELSKGKNIQECSVRKPISSTYWVLIPAFAKLYLHKVKSSFDNPYRGWITKCHLWYKNVIILFFSLSLHEIDRKKAVQKVHDTLGFILTQHHISLQIFTQINHIAFWCWYSFFTNLHLVCFKYVQLKKMAPKLHLQRWYLGWIYWATSE